MSNGKYIEIKETLDRMLKIEFDKCMEDMKETNFFIDGENNKLMIKNYNKDYDFIEMIDCYFYVKDYNIIIYFQIGYSFNEYELIEFEFEEVL